MRVFSHLFALTSALLLTAAASAGQLENPTFKTWTSCKPGTTIVLRDMHKSATGERKTELKYTLLSVAADFVEVNIEMTTEMKGKTMTMPAHKQKIARMIDEKEDSTAGLKEIEKAPTESVTVPAGTFKAKVWEHVINADATLSMKSKIWLAFDVPGGNVKTEMYSGPAGKEKLTSTIELVSIDRK